MKNGTMMQYFEWYLKADSSLWKKIKSEAKKLKDIGITALWLPPAYKGNQGINDVGYAVYDLYDLGEFNQKGSIPTKYGTKEEYIDAIKTLKENNIDTYADISVDHKIGADDTEIVVATEFDYEDRNKIISEEKTIEAWTKFTFPNRNNIYSNFKWNWTHFDAVDFDVKTQKNSIYKFYTKEWDQGVDTEHGNYDYLMGADLDLSNPEVCEELKKWGSWYIDTTNIDGFRIDAAKHTSYSFLTEWINYLRNRTNKELFSVAEYWHADINVLDKYIKATEGITALFDVPLHYHFYDASKSSPSYDMRNILNNTLIERDPIRAVTFVDNHDTQIGQALESWVEPWFKPIAYSIILLRAEGYPCVFYGDYYGVEYYDYPPMNNLLDILLKVRRDYAYGKQNSYFDDPNIIGWTREGSDEYNNSGVAVLLSNGKNGIKSMYIGNKFAGKTFFDITNSIDTEVTIDEKGFGTFVVDKCSISVWILKNNN